MSLLLFKAGVRLVPDPAGARILGTLDRLTRELAYDLTITAGADSHPPTDPHTLGRAFDVRTHDLTLDQKLYVLRAVLLDLQDGAADAPETLAIAGIPHNLATRYFFGQLENEGGADEHLHFQLRRGATLPETTT